MTEETNRSEAARKRWEGLTPEQRRTRTANGSRAARISAAERRIDKARAQIIADQALIAELISEGEDR